MSQSLEDRIQTLLAEGKITPEDAARLRGAIEPPETPRSWEGMSVATETTTPDMAAVSVQKPEPLEPPPPPRAPRAPRAPEAPAIPENAERYREYTYSGPVRKVIVQSKAGNLEISGGGKRERLEIESQGGEFQVLAEDGVITIRNQFHLMDFPKPMEWLQDPLKALRGVLPCNLELTLPEGVEVLEVQSVAGNLEIEGVRARVEVEMKAGNIELEDATSFDIRSTAGNVEVSARLEGPHTEESRIVSTAGNVELRLERGSSVRLSASTQAGHLDLEGFKVTKRDKRVVGERVEATLGAGEVALEVRVQAGNLDIEGDA